MSILSIGDTLTHNSTIQLTLQLMVESKTGHHPSMLSATIAKTPPTPIRSSPDTNVLTSGTGSVESGSTTTTTTTGKAQKIFYSRFVREDAKTSFAGWMGWISIYFFGIFFSDVNRYFLPPNAVSHMLASLTLFLSTIVITLIILHCCFDRCARLPCFKQRPVILERIAGAGRGRLKRKANPIDGAPSSSPSAMSPTSTFASPLSSESAMFAAAMTPRLVNHVDHPGHVDHPSIGSHASVPLRGITIDKVMVDVSKLK